LATVHGGATNYSDGQNLLKNNYKGAKGRVFRRSLLVSAEQIGPFDGHTPTVSNDNSYYRPNVGSNAGTTRTDGSIVSRPSAGQDCITNSSPAPIVNESNYPALTAPTIVQTDLVMDGGRPN